MATKTSSVIARVDKETKNQAEIVLKELGVSASTVINMLYKQIVMTKSIPFSISIPQSPLSREEMSRTAFDKEMSIGLEQAKADRSRPASDVFNELEQEMREWTNT